MREVFISYKSNDRDLGNNDESVANELCRQLESAGISCWIAPRDIEPGARSYEGAIIRAITRCEILLLIFSKYSNESDDVFNEVTAAARRKKQIIPFRIDDVELCDRLEYHLGSVQWINASSNVGNKIPELIVALKRKLGKSVESGTFESSAKQPIKDEPAYIEAALVGKESHDASSSVTEEEKAQPTPKLSSVKEFTVKGVSFKMVRVDGGSFIMKLRGATESEPAHRETLSTYYIGETQVTNALSLVVMPRLLTESPTRPVVSVSWHQCQEFIGKLNELTGVKKEGYEFCLPTEAQWEFAARGGNKSRCYRFAGSDYLQEVAWYSLPQSKPKPVGEKKPNELGLYDMSGNVWEWCLDELEYYPPELFWTRVPTKDIKNAGRVCRGGSFKSNSESDLRVTSREVCKPDVSRNDLGFRLALRMIEDQQ